MSKKSHEDTINSLRAEIKRISLENSILLENERKLHTMLEKIPEAFESLDINGNILLKSKMKTQSILDAAPIGIGVVVERVFEEVNNEFCVMLGYSREELIGRVSENIYVTKKEFQRVGEEKYTQILAKGRGSVETQFKKKDGSIIDVILSSVPLDSTDLSKGVTFTVLYITEQKKLQGEQQKLLEQLEESQSIAKLGSWSLDINNNILTWTDETYRIFGVDKKDPITHERFKTLVHPEDIDNLNKAWENALDGEEYNIEHRIIVEGEIKWINEKGRIVFDKEARPLRAFGTAQDITQLKKKDEMILAQSRLAAMGEMIGMIAHQWRQPLTVISMDANNMLLDIRLDDLNINNIKEYADDILMQTQHLSKTIDDFRNFFKPDKSASRLKIKEVLESTYIIVKDSLVNNNISLETSYTSESEVDAYERELMQVFVNIIMNAKDSLMQQKPEHACISIKVFEDEKAVITDICDNGTGIDKAILSKVFDPYFTTKDEKTGTGLGLYMSKMIIEDHLHGHIEAYNQKISGACFRVKLYKPKLV